ncbi:MAG TPA: hypothetical protein VFS42_07440 [Burkholderiaceae bacterium]|nr:hypothetical protein [Burkholderiaceae bacterium]
MTLKDHRQSSFEVELRFAPMLAVGLSGLGLAGVSGSAAVLVGYADEFKRSTLIALGLVLVFATVWSMRQIYSATRARYVLRVQTDGGCCCVFSNQSARIMWCAGNWMGLQVGTRPIVVGPGSTRDAQAWRRWLIYARWSMHGSRQERRFKESGQA